MIVKAIWYGKRVVACGFRSVFALLEQGVSGWIRKGRHRPYRALRGRFLTVVHPPAACYQPLQIELWILPGHPLDEIEAWLVPTGKDMGNARTGDANAVGELGLADIFGGQKLLQALVHFS